MKRLIFITSLLLMAFVSKCQTPFIGDRLFISADKQDSMWIRFIGDTILFRGDNGFFKFSKALMVDSIRLKDGKWHKSIVTVESDPIYNAEKSQYLKTEADPQYYSEKSTILLKADSSLIYGTRYMVGRSIKDSLANIKTRYPVISLKPTRDSVSYEMIGSGRSYKIPVTFSIYRPAGSAIISSINLAGKALTVPIINEGETITGIDTITFGQYPTVTTDYKKTFQLKVVAGRDTVKQDLVLGQYWKIYVGPAAFYSGVVDDWSFTSLQSELVIDGKSYLTNASAAGSQLMIGIPTEFVNKIIYINGLPSKFIQYNTRSTNFMNSRGAVHSYKGLVSQSKIIGNIQSIEIR